MRAIYRQLKSMQQGLRHQLLSLKLKEMGADVHIEPTVKLDYPDHITIGDRVRVAHCTVLRGNTQYDGQSGIVLEDDAYVQDFCLLNANDGSITIGERSWLGAGSHIYGNGHVKIGSDVLIAAHTIINTVSHHHDRLDKPINDQGIFVDPVTIEDDVWIGAGVRIMQGVTIGRGAIVGANSLVNRDVPAYSISYGSPARVTGYRSMEMCA